MKGSHRIRGRRVGPLWLALALFAAAFAASAADFFVSVNVAPPPIPVYEQPLCPGPGYIWVPGYWAWGAYGYYWVPGTWVLAPFVGALWTPGYWGWSGAVYEWHPGYWSHHVGFYGGIDYGFGYFGVGYTGGYWNRGTFYYNAAVDHVDPRIVHHVYRRNVVHVANGPHVSYHGGRGGTTARPTAAELVAAREGHRSATPMQLQHERLARSDRALRAAVNHGSPRIAATRRPAQFERSVARAAGPVGRAAPPQVAHAPSRAPQARTFATPRAATEARHAPPPMGSRSGGFEQRPQMLAMPRQSMRPEGMAGPHGPTPQAMPRPEMHAHNMPRPQGPPHEGRGGREERRHG